MNKQELIREVAANGSTTAKLLAETLKHVVRLANEVVKLEERLTTLELKNDYRDSARNDS